MVSFSAALTDNGLDFLLIFRMLFHHIVMTLVFGQLHIHFVLQPLVGCSTFRLFADSHITLPCLKRAATNFASILENQSVVGPSHEDFLPLSFKIVAHSSDSQFWGKGREASPKTNERFSSFVYWFPHPYQRETKEPSYLREQSL